MSKFKILHVNNLNITSDIKFDNTVETVNTHINNSNKHRVINDSSVLATDLWSANKIDTSLNLKQDLSFRNVPNGYAGLTSGALIPSELLPPLAITKPVLYANLSARDADVVNIQMGDVAIVTDVQKSYIYSGTTFIELITTGSVASINGLSGGSIQLYTEDIHELTNLYYTEARVSANTDLVSNTNRVITLENDTTGTWYESTSGEVCTEVFPSTVSEISSSSQGTSFTPIPGTYRVSLNAQFELTKGGTILSRVPAAINSLKDQLNELTYTAHGAAYGSETLTAGNYYIAGATTHTGVLELDAQNDPNATFVIKCGAAHSIEVGASTLLSNGAQACNVFYYVIGALSAGAGCTVVGTFVGDAAVGLGVNCTLDGRLFTTLGAMTTSDTMALPIGDAYLFDLGYASQYVLFNIAGDITNPTPAANPSIINSGLVACGAGTVSGFPPYDGIYTVDPETTPTVRISFGIYNNGVLSPSSLTYVENNIYGKYYSVSLATTVVNTGELISARIGVDSVKGSAIVTNRTLYGYKLK
jgi:hypothetical protein